MPDFGPRDMLPETRALLEELEREDDETGHRDAKLFRKQRFEAFVRDRLNEAGLPRARYLIAQRFAMCLKGTLLRYGGPELALRLRIMLVCWEVEDPDSRLLQRLVLACCERIRRDGDQSGHSTLVIRHSALAKPSSASCPP